jgi:hypothetical protein
MDDGVRHVGRRRLKIGCLVLVIGLLVVGGRWYLRAQKVKQEAAELCSQAPVGSMLNVDELSKKAEAYGFRTGVRERPPENLLICLKHVFLRSHYGCGVYYREGVVTRTELAWSPD